MSSGIPALSASTLSFAAATVLALGLRGSAFHMDVRLRNGRPVLIEAGARLSRAYIPLGLAAAGID